VWNSFQDCVFRFYIYENVLEKCWSVNNLDLLYDSIFHGIFLCGSFPCLAAREEIELIQVPHETVNNANCHRLLIIATSRAISLDFYYQYLIVFIISCMYINVKVFMYIEVQIRSICFPSCYHFVCIIIRQFRTLVQKFRVTEVEDGHCSEGRGLFWFCGCCLGVKYSLECNDNSPALFAQCWVCVSIRVRGVNPLKS